jgi:hypothetical protein
MRYDWDERKNRLNQKRQDGISFELAAPAFENERASIGPDRVDESGEQRWHVIGAVSIEPWISAVFLVVHAYREDGEDGEIIRIISARRAEEHELRRYQEQSVE